MALTDRQRSHVYRLCSSMRRNSDVGKVPSDLSEINLLMGVSTINPIVMTPMRDGDQDIAGNEWHKRQITTRWDTSLNAQYNASRTNIAQALAFVMARSVKTGAGPYIYESTWGEAVNKDLPVTSMIQYGPMNQKLLITDLALDTLEIAGSGSVESLITLNEQWKGSGRFTRGVTHASPAQILEDRIRMGGLIFEFGPAGGPLIEMQIRLKSFTFNINNQMPDLHRPGGDKFASRAEVGARRLWGLQFTIDDDGTDEFMEMFADTGGLDPMEVAAKLTLKDDTEIAVPGTGTKVEIEMKQAYIQDFPFAAGEEFTNDVTLLPVWNSALPGYDAAAPGSLRVKVTTPDEFDDDPLSLFTEA